MKARQFPISLYGWSFWFPVLVTGSLITITFAAVCWPVSLISGVLTLAVLAFYRDFHRPIPAEPGLMVSPADGHVTDVRIIEHYEPLGGPALMVGIFLSVFDVHVNRSPCDATVLSRTYQEGLFLDARHPECGPKNQAALLVLGDQNRKPIAAVKQIVGAIARRIICPIEPGETLTRGERYGMIAFGSRTELYVPHPEQWEALVQVGEHVKGGSVKLLKRK